MVWALVAASVSGAVFVALSAAHVGGLLGFVVPVWAILAAMGLVIPNAPAVALSRHHRGRGHRGRTAGCGAVRPRRGRRARWSACSATTSSRWRLVMTAGVMIALVALLLTGAHRTARTSTHPW